MLGQGVDANTREEGGDTALMRAALYADVEIMGILLSSGADLNARGPDGTTALIRAVHDPDKVRLLLGQGAVAPPRSILGEDGEPRVKEGEPRT